MRQIRRGVFETNSSSSHSISVGNGLLEPNYMRISDDGYIHASFGEFGWEIANYNDQSTKLAYLLTMAMHKNGLYIWFTDSDEQEKCVAEFMRTDDFEHISSEIGNYAGCSGIIVDSSEGYIDHQSLEDYTSLDDFLKQNNTSIIDFIFCPSTILHTDNDNH